MAVLAAVATAASSIMFKMRIADVVSLHRFMGPAHEHGGIAVWLKAFRRGLRHPARSPFSVGIPELGPWTGFLRAAPTMNGARLIWYILRMTMGME